MKIMKQSLHDILPPSRVVAVGLIVTSVAFGAGALMLGLWNHGMPGVGLVPLLASIALLPIAAILLFEPLTANSDEDDVRFQYAPFVVGIGFCLYCVGLAYTGLIVSTAIALIVWIRWVYKRPWTTTLIGAFGVTLGIYVIFIRLLRIPLRTFWF